MVGGREHGFQAGQLAHVRAPFFDTDLLLTTPVDGERRYARRLEQAGNGRPGFGLQAVGPLGARRTRIDLLAHQPQEDLCRAGGAPVAQVSGPTLGGQRPGGGQGRAQRLGRRLVAGGEILDPALQAPQAPGAATARLGAEQPAPQVIALLTG